MPHQHDIAVIGAGVIGLAVGWRARQRGLSVVIIDRGQPGAATSYTAGGMLAAVAEADGQERALLSFALESARRWPAFAKELRDVTGVDVGHRTNGTLLLARDADEAAALDREHALRSRLGLDARRLAPSQARRLEPALAPTLRAALELAGDHAVDPRAVCAALSQACVQAGAELRVGVEVGDAGEVDARRVVIAAGAWSAAFGDVPVRPVKGQALMLRDPSGPGLCDRVLRFEGGYVVPRGDGRYYVGASSEERGYDTTMSARAVHDLLRDAAELLPGLLELELEETLCGLRPGTPDNAPILGADPDDERLIWATGHYRGGFLLAPVTADLIVAELCGEPADHAFRRDRFSTVPA